MASDFMRNASMPDGPNLDDSTSQKRQQSMAQVLRARTYALNDFDDAHSVSDIAGDMSMMSGSFKHNRFSSAVPYIEANHLEPSRNLMAGMAADSTTRNTNNNV